MSVSPPVVLAIAGFDGSGGAGIHADVRAINRNGAYACTVVTAITAQNSREVLHVEPLASGVVDSQLQAIFNDFDVAAIKIGLIPNVAILESILAVIEVQDSSCSIVIDPVLVASSGTPLVDNEMAEVLATKLIPYAHVVTPNIHELATLTHHPVESLDDAVKAGRNLLELGAQHVLVTGGHLQNAVATDILIAKETLEYFHPERTYEGTVRGTGCMFSSALAAFLANRLNPIQATSRAKAFITGVFEASSTLGKGTPLTTTGIVKLDEQL